jgi:hypothetical protein
MKKAKGKLILVFKENGQELLREIFQESFLLV